MTPMVIGLLKKTKAPIITYSIDGNGTLNAHDVDMTPKSSRYTVSYDGHDYTVAMNTTGLFNVYNTLAGYRCLFVRRYLHGRYR